MARAGTNDIVERLLTNELVVFTVNNEGNIIFKDVEIVKTPGGTNGTDEEKKEMPIFRHS